MLDLQNFEIEWEEMERIKMERLMSERKPKIKVTATKKLVSPSNRYGAGNRQRMDYNQSMANINSRSRSNINSNQ